MTRRTWQCPECGEWTDRTHYRPGPNGERVHDSHAGDDPDPGLERPAPATLW